jgi:hypothetical protein
MNSCVLFIILRNNSTTKLKQLEGVFFVIVLKKSASFKHGEFVEMRGSISIGTFSNCKVCVEGAMLVILR